MNSLEKIIVAIRAEFDDYIHLRTGSSYVPPTETTSDTPSPSRSPSPKLEDEASRGTPIEGSQSNTIYETLGSVVSYAASFFSAYASLPSLPNPFSTNKILTKEKVAQALEIVEICTAYQLRAGEFNKTDTDAIKEFVESMLSDLSKIFRTKKTLAENILSKYNNQTPGTYDAKLAFVTVLINELQNDSKLLCSMLKAELDPDKLKFESKEGVLAEEHECRKEDVYKYLPLHISSFMYGNLLRLKIDTHKKKEKVLDVTEVLPDGPETKMKSIINDKLIVFLEEIEAKSSLGAKAKLETTKNILGALMFDIDQSSSKSYVFMDDFKRQVNIYGELCQKFLSAVNVGLENKNLHNIFQQNGTAKTSDQGVTTKAKKGKSTAKCTV